MSDNKKDIFRKNYKYILVELFLILNFLNCILLQFITINHITIRSLIANGLILLFLGVIGLFLNKKYHFKYYLSISILIAIINIANSMYYTFYDSYISISLIATTTQVLDVSDALTENVVDFNSLIYLVFPIIFYIFFKYYYKKNQLLINYSIEKELFGKVFIFIAVASFIFMITLSSNQINKFNKVWNKSYVVANFGILVYQFNDIFNNILSIGSYSLDDYNQFLTFVENNQNNYQTNEYSNIFENKNIIMIHAESIENTVLFETFNDIELTPNLNKLATEGIFFSNYYSPVSSGTSADAEFMLNTSLLPSTTGTAFMNYTDNKYITFTNLLSDKNYYTFSMHANDGTFWNRNIMHYRLGYDYFYDKSSFEIDEIIGLGLSDKSFFNQAIDIIYKNEEESKNFFTNLITLTNHTPFNELDKYGEFDLTYTNEFGEVFEYLEGSKIGNYFKSVHYFDTVLGEFLTSLEDNDLLENTVIILYGDHDNLYNAEEYEILYNYDFNIGEIKDKNDETYQTYDKYEHIISKNVPLIVWTLDTQYQENIGIPMSTIDILPTIGNMFGINNYYSIGSDIMNFDNNVVIFKDASWRDNDYYYDSQLEKIITINDIEIDYSYIDIVNEKVDNLMTISDNIIKYDLIDEWGSK